VRLLAWHKQGKMAGLSHQPGPRRETPKYGHTHMGTGKKTASSRPLRRSCESVLCEELRMSLGPAGTEQICLAPGWDRGGGSLRRFPAWTLGFQLHQCSSLGLRASGCSSHSPERAKAKAREPPSSLPEPLTTQSAWS
jgi:hypothetical protein